MKLRALALLLVLSNLGFYIWSQGWLDAVTGVRATGDREPERSARQFQPQVLRVLPSAAGAAAMAGGATPTAAGRCLEAGPFTPADADAALAQWRERGVQTASVVPRALAGGDLMLRVESANAALAAQLTATTVEAATLPFGKAFAPCAQ
jgi:hypothetical protein